MSVRYKWHHVLVSNIKNNWSFLNRTLFLIKWSLSLLWISSEYFGNAAVSTVFCLVVCLFFISKQSSWSILILKVLLTKMFLFFRVPEKSADKNSRGWPLGGYCLYYTTFFISPRDGTLLLRKLEVFCGQSVGPRRPWGQGFSSCLQENDPAMSFNPPNEQQFYSNRRAVLLTKNERPC